MRDFKLRRRFNKLVKDGGAGGSGGGGSDIYKDCIVVRFTYDPNTEDTTSNIPFEELLELDPSGKKLVFIDSDGYIYTDVAYDYSKQWYEGLRFSGEYSTNKISIRYLTFSSMGVSTGFKYVTYQS